MRLALALLLSLAATARADDPDLAVSVDRAGPVALPAALVLDHFGDESIPLDALHLQHAGQSVAYEVDGGEDGVLDRADTLLFASEGPRDRHTRQTVYFLRHGAGIPVRFEPAPASDSAAMGAEVLVRVVLEEDRARATFEENLFDLGADVDRWFWEGVGAGGWREVSLQLPHPVASGEVALEIELVGEAPHGRRAGAEVSVRGRAFGSHRAAAGERVVARATVDAGDIEGGAIRVRLESNDPDVNRKLWLDRVVCEYLAPGRVEGILPFVATEPGRVELSAPSGEEIRVWSLDHPRSWRLPGGKGVVAVAPGRYVAFTLAGALPPTGVRPRLGAELLDPAEGSDWLAIVPDEFAEALAPLVEHRRAQGFHVRTVSPAAIYDVFGEGEFGPRAIRDFLVHAAGQWAAPRLAYVLLAADATWDVDRHGGPVIPTWTVETYLNGETGSDEPYADLDGDHLPDLAVGRLPARTADELAHFVARTIEYEVGPLPGAWRKRISFVTGEGRFGGAADQLLENVFKKMVSDLIPDAYDVDVTFASPTSPYLFVPSRLNEKVIERLNSGSLFHVYVGHGFAKGFDSLRWQGKRYPILNVEHLPRVEVTEGMPIVFVLACTTGAFDDPVVQSIGEGLLRRPEGPVAFLGASRVSHPYAMGILSRDMIDLVFHSNAPRLGEALRVAKRRLVDENPDDAFRKFVDFSARMMIREGPPLDRIRVDHACLFNLLGDPALLIARTRHSVDLVPDLRGDRLEVAGLVEGMAGGRLVLTLESTRDVILQALEPLQPGAADLADVIARNYAKANDKVLVRKEADLAANPFLHVLEVPPDLPAGTYLVKAWCEGDGTAALGAVRIHVR